MLRFIFLILLLFQSSLQAWWAVPHKISAQIAYLNLTDKAKKEIDQIIPDFLEASNWADNIKTEQNIRLFDAWHFTDIPYDPDRILTADQRNKILARNDALWFLNIMIPFLSGGECPKESKQWTFSTLIHVVSDLHQPMHATSLYSSKFPKGDRGGNRFKITEMKTKNLHQLWDSVLELFSSRNETDEHIEKYARSLMHRFPRSSFQNIEELNPRVWAMESQKIAIEHAYQLREKTKPSEEYIRRGREIACERLTLSGYRLAFVLNKILDPSF